MQKLDELNLKIEEYLFSLWDEMTMDIVELPKRFHTIVDFLLYVGLITSERHELWLYRIQKCPNTDHIGGLLWCAYCGDIKRTCCDCIHLIGEECGIDGHEVYSETEACGSFEYL